MPILYREERNNLNTQCIMKFRFLVKDDDGFSHSIEKVFTNVDAAIEGAKMLVMDVIFVGSVTLCSQLTDDSCGPIKFIDEIRYEYL